MRKLWAVARNVIALGVRMKIAYLVIVFAVITIFIFPFTLRSEGTLTGRLQLFSTYSLTTLTFLLSVLTIALSTATLCSEIKQKQIFMVDTKPIARWQVLLGKCLGVIVLDAVLLALMGGASFGMLYYIYRHDAKSPADRSATDNSFWVARVGFKPKPPNVDAEVEEQYKRLREAGRLPEVETVEEAREEIRRTLLVEYGTVPHRHERKWTLTGLPRRHRADRDVTIRFRCFSADTMRDREVVGEWIVEGAGTTPYKARTAFIPEPFHEFSVSSDVLGPDGTLTITYQNTNPIPASVVFPYDEGVEVLVPVGGFAANYLRGVVLVLFRLVFLAALGLMAGTFLTFPVAPIFALCVLLAASSSGFVRQLAQQELIFTSTHRHGPESAEPIKPSMLDVGARLFMKGLDAVLPDFSRYNPVPSLNAGRSIPLGVLLRGLGSLVLLYGGGSLLLGALIFHRRQLAALHG